MIFLDGYNSVYYYARIDGELSLGIIDDFQVRLIIEIVKCLFYGVQTI